MHKNILFKLSPRVLKLVKQIGFLADQQRLRVYLVGGVVRDLILNRINQDLDFVVEGDAIQFAQQFCKKNNISYKSYRQFGTATVYFQDGLEIDFSSSRKEIYEFSGALPKVEPGYLKEDLFRRDFTINAMAISVNGDTFGRIVDFYGGLKDLKTKRIRILHVQSFVDDPTRILRCVRFSVRLGFQIEVQTLRLLKIGIRNKLLSNVKMPRLFQELKKNFSERKIVHQLRALKKLNILPAVHRDLRIDFKKISVIENYFRKNDQSSDWLFVLMSLIAVMKESKLTDFSKLIQLKSDDAKILSESLALKKILGNLNKPLLKPSEVYMILRSFRSETVRFFYILAETAMQRKRLKRFITKDSHCHLNINGDDLKKNGFIDGKNIRKTLEYVLFQKINGKIKTKKQELAVALLSL